MLARRGVNGCKFQIAGCYICMPMMYLYGATIFRVAVTVEAKSRT
jgi:hypothetical protein